MVYVSGRSRARRRPAGLIPAIRRELAAIDKGLPIHELQRSNSPHGFGR